MSSLKDRISAPLEAGTSLLDAQHLPPHVDAALQYVAKRLARKEMNVTLVVVKREEGEAPPQSHSMSVATSGDSDDESDGIIPIMLAPAPAAVAAVAASPPRRPSIMSTALGRLSRSSTQPILPTMRRASAAAAAAAAAATAKGLKRSTSSNSTNTGTPQPPATPAMSMTTMSTDVSGTTQTSPNPFGIHLVHTQELDARAERVLRQTIDKAERKFGLGTDWLPHAVEPAERGLADLLVRRSVAQNEVLFSADGLTLLSLDHLYTFKRALAAYTRTGCQRRLEDAVDELRRCVLANGRRRLQRSHLMRVYPGLSFAEHALFDVTKMYRRAYGGPLGDTGIECDPLSYSPPFEGGAMPAPAPAPAPAAAAAADSPPSSHSRSSGTVSYVVRPIRRNLSLIAAADAAPELPSLMLGDSATSIISQAAASAGISERDEDLAAVSRTGEFVRSERTSVSSAASTTSRSAPSMPPTPTTTTTTMTNAAAVPIHRAAPCLKVKTLFATAASVAPAAAAAAAAGESEGQIGVAITTGEWDESAPETALSGQDDYFAAAAAAADDGSLTARPCKQLPVLAAPNWDAPATAAAAAAAVAAAATAAAVAATISQTISQIDEVMLSPFGIGGASLRGSAQLLGPPAPQDYGDVSPITRGEWEFLMGAGDSWKAKTVAVETC
ncbi:hypothetical protein RB600_000882 [Gaeumannomyces tritici]